MSSPCVTCQNVWDDIVHVDVARFLKAPQLIALLEGVGYQQSRYHVYGGDYSNQLNQTNLLVVGLLQRKHGYSFHFLKLWASQMWPYFIPQRQYIHVAFAFLKEEEKNHFLPERDLLLIFSSLNHRSIDNWTYCSCIAYNQSMLSLTISAFKAKKASKKIFIALNFLLNLQMGLIS
jgi:hypothetical protein